MKNIQKLSFPARFLRSSRFERLPRCLQRCLSVRGAAAAQEEFGDFEDFEDLQRLL